MTRPNAEWLLPPAEAHRIGPLSCNEPYPETLQLIRHPGGIRAALKWARMNRPSEYTCNLRPGLPLWLFWAWHPLGVPIRGVIMGNQLTASPTNPAHNALLGQVIDAWELCTWQEMHRSPKDRDEAVATFGNPVTMAHILSDRLAHAQPDTPLMEAATSL
jgi:hypothetical protein